jgi:hypothetical protein
VSLAVVARDPVPESEAPGAGSLTVLDSLEASLILTLRWFEAGRSNAPLFVYDDLFESDEWGESRTVSKDVVPLAEGYSWPYGPGKMGRPEAHHFLARHEHGMARY